jgi:hypothetical protein
MASINLVYRPPLTDEALFPGVIVVIGRPTRRERHISRTLVWLPKVETTVRTVHIDAVYSFLSFRLLVVEEGDMCFPVANYCHTRARRPSSTAGDDMTLPSQP